MVSVQVHKTGTVWESTRDTAESAAEKMDDDLDNNFVVVEGKGDLDNSKAPGTNESSRYDWLDYVEDTLHSAGNLGQSNLHVVLYQYSQGGAGFAQFNWGGPKSDGGFWGIKSFRTYESQDGYYGIANINIETAGWPYTSEWYENTVIHEIGHLFDLEHYHGAIRQNSSGDNFASPMVTWYVEEDCNVGINPDPSEDLCTDESGSKDACNHWQQISNCTINKSDQWIDNH